MQEGVESNPNALIAKLARSGLLAPDDHATLETLCVRARVVPPGTVLVDQGEAVGDVPLILDGVAHRHRTLPDASRQILGLLLPGDFCDPQAVLLGRADHAVATLTEATVVRIPQARIDALMLAPTRLARALWWATAVDTGVLRAWLTNMGRRSADRGLAHLACELLLRLQAVGRAGAASCDWPLRQDQLADVLGITAVHVNRVLRDLRERDLLHLSGRRLRVPDVARLQAFAGFDPAYLHVAMA